MLDHDQIEAFREDDAVLSRCADRWLKGTVPHRHIMPNEQIPLIRVALFYRDVARQRQIEVEALGRELFARNAASMSPGEPEYPVE